jgi:hypothetical protein
MVLAVPCVMSVGLCNSLLTTTYEVVVVVVFIVYVCTTTYEGR